MNCLSRVLLFGTHNMFSLGTSMGTHNISGASNECQVNIYLISTLSQVLLMINHKIYSFVEK